jgi:sugar lactone lactonase YvrE
VVNKTAERPYPSSELNLPPSKLNTSWNGIDFGSGDSKAFISVQALYITAASSRRPETLWVLDTGRPTIHNAQGEPSMPYAQPGGPKLVAISLVNDTIYQTFTFDAKVHFPDSYLNDLRFDFNPNLSGTSGAGIAYLVDSSNEGRPGFIMVDLGTGKSWRRLNQDPSVIRVQNDVPSYQGSPSYLRQKGSAITWEKEGNDGIQISPDGSRLYYSALTSKHLYSIPTANLREQDTNPLAEIQAHANVSSHGQRGGDANGFEGDSNGLIYQLMPESNAIYYFDPRDGMTHGFVRDERMIWPDGASIATDGYLYVNINQLPYGPDRNNGVDARIFPGVILRCKVPGNGTKIASLFKY